MRGLIFNLLADLARDTGCERDAWTVALAVSQEVNDEIALEIDDDEPIIGFLTEASLQGGADFTFRWLLRSAAPFSDDDWADALKGPIAAAEELESASAGFASPPRRPPSRE